MNMSRKNFLRWSAITTGGIVFGTALPACGGGGGGGSNATAAAMPTATPTAIAAATAPAQAPAQPATGPVTIAASLAASRVTGVAPLYVNFDATGTTHYQSTNPTHELFYSWMFDDAGAGNWANGVQSAGLTSKNAAFGPVTGHVFETPGTYTVNLVVMDGVNTVSKSVTITVQDPDVVYAGTKTICISSSGNFAGAPSGAVQYTAPSTDIYAAITAHKASNKRILLCKADAWIATAQLVFDNLSGMTLGGYGSGGAAATFGSGTLVHVTPNNYGGAQGASTFLVNTGNTDMRICNFKIASNGTVHAAAVNSTMSGMLFYKVEIRGCSQGFNILASSGSTVCIPDQVCFYECLVDDLYGTPFVDYISGTQLHGGIGIYASLTRGGVMGCYLDTCNHGEQTLRIPFIDRGHINNNFIARPNQTKNTLKIHSVIHSAFPVWSEKFVVNANVFSTRNGYAFDNVTTTQTANQVICCGSGGNSNPDGSGGEWVRNGIIENNYAESCLGAPKSVLVFAFVSCPNMTIRNNIADFSVGDRTTAFSTPYTYTSVNMVEVTTSTRDTTIGVRIYNNTLYSNLANAEKVSFVVISPPTGTNVTPDQITIKNNIWYTPFHINTFNRGAVYQQSGAGTNIVASNNTDTNGRVAQNTPNFTATPPVTLADWKPATGSYAINTGAAVPVLRDFNNVNRYGGGYHMGAVLP